MFQKLIQCIKVLREGNELADVVNFVINGRVFLLLRLQHVGVAALKINLLNDVLDGAFLVANVVVNVLDKLVKFAQTFTDFW